MLNKCANTLEDVYNCDVTEVRQLIKSVGDVTDKLIDLQKKLKDVEEESSRTTNNTTNNAIFIGSSSELSKILKQGFLNSKE